MKKFYLYFTILCLFVFAKNTKAQTITTIAGTGTQGYNGDNIAATVAQLNRPASITSDNIGNIYVADYMNNRVRKIDVNGFITTTVGTGTQGYNGDNIMANAANLYSPVAVAFDQPGNLYIADGNNNRIRKVSTTSLITTFAGTGSFGYNGDNIAATSAQVNYPSDGVVVDASGNVFFSDSYNHRIRKVNTSGIITTIAGTGIAGYNGDNILATTAQLNLPYGLTIDRVGNLYLIDGSNQRVRKISTSGVITTIAGNGSTGYNGDNIAATNAMLNNPRSVVLDAAGNIFIADALNHRIRKVSTNGIITSIAGNGTGSYNGDNIPAALATLNFPNGLTLDVSGNLLIADLGNNRIRKITNAGVILPLSMVKFSAQLKNDAGLLQWQTSNEINVQQFIVESGKDGITFSVVDSVKAKNAVGTNSYYLIDPKITNGTNYYRLKMVDNDGKFVYSNIVTIKVNATILSLNLHPNPAENFAYLSFTSPVASKFLIQITNIMGKIITQLNGKAAAGLNMLSIDLHNYVAGTYILSITNAEKVKNSIKFVKN